MMDKFLERSTLSKREKLAFFRSMLKREMDVLNEYCTQILPLEYRVEFCHLENVKKLNIARLLQVIEYYEPDFVKLLATTDPRVRTFMSYYFDFLRTNPYGYEALEHQNLFGNWDYIKYKLKILFPSLTLEEIEKFKLKRKEFIEYVTNKLGENRESVEIKLNNATWYESIPYLELEEEMSGVWHPEPIMTDEEWEFIKRHIKGRKNIFIRENGTERFVYVEVDIPEEELDKYRKDREGLKKLLMSKLNIDESGAEQILRKAGWESETYHIIPPVHTDVVVDYGKEQTQTKAKEGKRQETYYGNVANFVRYIGGLELETLNYYDLIYEKLEDEVKVILDRITLTHKRILGKLFGIFYTADPLMAEAILTINPERFEFLKELTSKITVRDKKFDLYSNSTAWRIVKERIVSRLPEVSEEDIESFKGKRAEFVKFASQKAGKREETIEIVLEECGWTKTEEIPPFLRQIGP